MRDSQKEWEIDSELHKLLFDFANAPGPLRILLEGPAGSGKSTLVHKAASRTNLSVLQFDRDTLACRSAEKVEENVAEVTANAIDCAPCVLLVDDVDLWLPKRIANPAQFHLLAHLNEAFRELDEQPAPNVALVLVVRNRAELHKALVCDGLRVVSIKPLVESERAAIIRDALDVDDVDEVVVRTPGFVTADMAQVLLEARRIASGDRLTLRHVEEAIGKVRPLLLGEQGKRWQFSTTGLNRSSTQLYGLDNEEITVRNALNAAFSRQKHVSLDAMGRVRGILIHGTTGSGKTALVSRATSWLPRDTVHVLRVDAVDVVDAVIGAAERAITRLFAAARAAAPSLLILENLHLLAPRRDSLSDGGNSADAAFERILSTLLVLLDGARQSREPVVLLATTPSIHLVEPAMLRPGRIELHVKTSLPDEHARRCIFSEALNNLLPDNCDLLGNEQLVDDMVRVTDGQPAAFINGLVSESAFSVLREDGLLSNGGANLGGAAESLTCARITVELNRRIAKLSFAE